MPHPTTVPSALSAKLWASPAAMAKAAAFAATPGSTNGTCHTLVIVSPPLRVRAGIQKDWSSPNVTPRLLLATQR